MERAGIVRKKKPASSGCTHVQSSARMGIVCQCGPGKGVLEIFIADSADVDHIFVHVLPPVHPDVIPPRRKSHVRLILFLVFLVIAGVAVRRQGFAPDHSHLPGFEGHAPANRGPGALHKAPAFVRLVVVVCHGGADRSWTPASVITLLRSPNMIKMLQVSHVPRPPAHWGTST
jgi:hypothetical protein